MDKPKFINGSSIGAVLDAEQQQCVEALTDALDEAMKGRISSLALVVCMDDGMAPILCGKNAGGLNLGLDQLKEQIRCAIFEDGNVAARQKKSSILRVK
jgi:hypothetical protein